MVIHRGVKSIVTACLLRQLALTSPKLICCHRLTLLQCTGCILFLLSLHLLQLISSALDLLPCGALHWNKPGIRYPVHLFQNQMHQIHQIITSKYIKPLTTAWRCSAIVWDFVAASSFQVSTSSWQSSNSWPPRAKTVHRWPRWAATKPTKPNKISRGTLAWRDTKAMFFWYLFFRVSNSSSAWRLSSQGCWDVYPTPTMIFCNLLWGFRNVCELLLNHLCSSAQLQAFVAGHHHPKSVRNGKIWEHQAQYKFQFHSEIIINTFVYILYIINILYICIFNYIYISLSMKWTHTNRVHIMTMEHMELIGHAACFVVFRRVSPCHPPSSSRFSTAAAVRSLPCSLHISNCSRHCRRSCHGNKRYLVDIIRNTDTLSWDIITINGILEVYIHWS